MSNTLKTTSKHTDCECGYTEKSPILLSEERECTIGCPKRYILTQLGFLGFFNVYAMRVNLSVAMVAMAFTPPMTVMGGSRDVPVACHELIPFRNHSLTADSSSTAALAHRYTWDSQTQSVILGSFFYGYVLTQIPGGILAEKYGAKWLFVVGIFITSFFTMLTPIAADWGVWALVIARALEGLGEGVTYPAMNSMIGRWSPKMERSRMASIIYTGATIGTVVSLSISGIVSATIGWPWVFYIFGAVGLAWCIPWIWLVYDSPETHPHITKEELLYIHKGQDEKKDCRSPIPWKEILTSKYVWALVLTHFGQGWGFYTLLTEMPTYLSNILHFDLKKNGLLSAFPYLVAAFASILSSFLADRLRKSGLFRVTTIRKAFNSFAFFIPGLCLFLVGYVGCNPMVIIILLTVATGANGLHHSGFIVTHVDMSPEFAGTLMGITNCISNLSGFLAPAYVGWIVQSGQTIANWKIVFLTTSAVFFLTGLIFNLFCTAEPQSWGKRPPQPSGEKDNENIKTTLIDDPS